MNILIDIHSFTRHHYTKLMLKYKMQILIACNLICKNAESINKIRGIIMSEKRDLRVQKTYNALFEAFHEILNLYHCAQENRGCQPIIFFVKRAGTVQPSLFLLKFPSVQQHEGFPGIAHRHQHPGEQVEFRQAPAGTGREDRGKFLFPRPDPSSTPAPAKRKAGSNKNLR